MSEQRNIYEAGQLMALDPVLGSIAGEFVYIPAGDFMMGSEQGDNNEKPVHKVIISSEFEIGRYQVTQWQWREVMGNNPSYFQRARFPYLQTDWDRLPIERVSWNEVDLF